MNADAEADLIDDMAAEEDDVEGEDYTNRDFDHESAIYEDFYGREEL